MAQDPSFAMQHHTSSGGAQRYVYATSKFSDHDKGIKGHNLLSHIWQGVSMPPPYGQPRDAADTPTRAVIFPPILDWVNRRLRHRLGRRMSQPFFTTTQWKLISFENHKCDIMINDLELGILLLQILLCFKLMAPLENIRTYVDNMAAQGWATCGSVSTATAVVHILQELFLVARQRNISSSILLIAGEEKNMADTASRLTHFSDGLFLSHLQRNFPQKNIWRILQLLPDCRCHMTSMLTRKISPKVSTWQFTRRTPHSMDSVETLLYLDTNHLRPPRHQMPHPFPPYIWQACLRRNSVHWGEPNK